MLLHNSRSALLVMGAFGAGMAMSGGASACRAPETAPVWAGMTEPMVSDAAAEAVIAGFMLEPEPEVTPDAADPEPVDPIELSCLAPMEMATAEQTWCTYRVFAIVGSCDPFMNVGDTVCILCPASGACPAHFGDNFYFRIRNVCNGTLLRQGTSCGPCTGRKFRIVSCAQPVTPPR